MGGVILVRGLLGFGRGLRKLIGMARGGVRTITNPL
jgi:hypothetical protein